MKHPGSITFVDEAEGTERVTPVDTVPESIAFYEGGAEPIPVVRIVSHLRGTQRVIRSYGADGELLTTTVQAPRP